MNARRKVVVGALLLAVVGAGTFVVISTPPGTLLKTYMIEDPTYRGERGDGGGGGNVNDNSRGTSVNPNPNSNSGPRGCDPTTLRCVVGGTGGACTSDAACGHMECSELKCVRKAGSGTDKCTDSTGPLGDTCDPKHAAGKCFQWDINIPCERDDCMMEYMGEGSRKLSPNLKKITISGNVKNYCSFDVHHTFLAHYDKTPGWQTGGSSASADWERTGVDIKQNFPTGTSSTWSLSFDPSSYNCGRVSGQSAWDAWYGDGARESIWTNGTGSQGTGLMILMNYGNKCTGNSTGGSGGDGSKPPPKTELTAACTAKPRKVQLTWKPVTGAKLNVLQRLTNDKGGMLPIFGEYQLPFKTYQFADDKVELGGKYVYQAKTGASVASNQVTVQFTQDGGCTVTGNPGGSGGSGSGTVLTLQCTNEAKPKVKLSWTRPADSTVNSVLKSVGTGNAAFVSPAPGATDTTYTDANVNPGQNYTYRVKTKPSVSSQAVKVAIAANGTCTFTGNPSGNSNTNGNRNNNYNLNNNTNTNGNGNKNSNANGNRNGNRNTNSNVVLQDIYVKTNPFNDVVLAYETLAGNAGIRFTALRSPTNSNGNNNTNSSGYTWYVRSTGGGTIGNYFRDSAVFIPGSANEQAVITAETNDRLHRAFARVVVSYPSTNANSNGNGNKNTNANPQPRFEILTTNQVLSGLNLSVGADVNDTIQFLAEGTYRDRTSNQTFTQDISDLVIWNAKGNVNKNTNGNANGNGNRNTNGNVNSNGNNNTNGNTTLVGEISNVGLFTARNPGNSLVKAQIGTVVSNPVQVYVNPELSSSLLDSLGNFLNNWQDVLDCNKDRKIDWKDSLCLF